MSTLVENSNIPDAAAEPQPVIVTVNRMPVIIPAKDTTGLQIKDAAIAAGVQIELSFVLFKLTKRGREMIGDHDAVKVKKKDEFVAVSDDVNS